MRISDWSSDVCSSDLLFGNPERLGLFRDLLVDQWRAHEARADHIGAHALLAAFLGDHAGEAEQAVLGGDIRRLQRRGDLGMRRAHEDHRSEEHTSELQSLMRISYAVFCVKKKNI